MENNNERKTRRLYSLHPELVQWVELRASKLGLSKTGFIESLIRSDKKIIEDKAK